MRHESHSIQENPRHFTEVSRVMILLLSNGLEVATQKGKEDNANGVLVTFL